MQAGVAGLLRDKTRQPGKPPLSAETVREGASSCRAGEAPGEATHWTAAPWPGRPASASPRCSGSGAAHGLQPHRMRPFKLSSDPEFAAKVKDIVGLYVEPPPHAVVLSIDEKEILCRLLSPGPGIAWDQRADAAIGDQLEHFDHFC